MARKRMAKSRSIVLMQNGVLTPFSDVYKWIVAGERLARKRRKEIEQRLVAGRARRGIAKTAGKRRPING